jgi:hypothetical protein
MAWTLVFWRNRSTSTVVQAASASQARSRAQHRHKKAMGSSWPHVAMVPAPSSAAAAIGLRHGDTAAATAPGCSSQLQAPAVGQPHGRSSLPAPSTSRAGTAAREASAAGGRSPGCCRATGCMLRSQLSVEPNPAKSIDQKNNQTVLKRGM